MTESPQPTEEEHEHDPSRIDAEEEMRGPNETDPELPQEEDEN